jgi:hypothetical protein
LSRHSLSRHDRQKIFTRKINVLKNFHARQKTWHGGCNASGMQDDPAMAGEGEPET